MKNKPVRLLGLFVVIAIFGLRVKNSFDQKKAREEQMEMMRELSRQQLQDRVNQQNDYNQQMLDKVEEEMIDLDSLQQNLDEMGEELEEQKERIENMK